MVMHYNVSLGTKRVISSRRITLLKVVHVNVLTSEFWKPSFTNNVIQIHNNTKIGTTKSSILIYLSKDVATLWKGWTQESFQK